jgi:hypothetical protein
MKHPVFLTNIFVFFTSRLPLIYLLINVLLKEFFNVNLTLYMDCY